MGNGLGIVAAKEADFMIHSLLKFELFGQELYLTTTHVSILLICLGLIILALIARVKLQDTDGKPGRFQNGSGLNKLVNAPTLLYLILLNCIRKNVITPSGNVTP